jgi:hypothetical protein
MILLSGTIESCRVGLHQSSLSLSIRGPPRELRLHARRRTRSFRPSLFNRAGCSHRPLAFGAGEGGVKTERDKKESGGKTERDKERDKLG